MSEEVLKTIELVQGQIRELEGQLVKKRRIVNDLCPLAGRQPIYPDSDFSDQSGTRPDEYYGVPLTDAMQRVLEKRRHLGAASVNDLYDALKAGGYSFKTSNEENAKRGVYGILSKNPGIFHKLPSGLYGLIEWYPEAKRAYERSQANGKPHDAAEDQDDAERDSEREAEAAGKQTMKKEFGDEEVPAEPAKTAK